MIKTGLLCLLLVLTPKVAQNLKTPLGLFVFNVGQGQWITWVEVHQCTHFDFGGERSAIKQVRDLCRKKVNRLALSHWDKDHYKFLSQLLDLQPDSCWLYRPATHKKKILSAVRFELPQCEPDPQVEMWAPVKVSSKKENDLSSAFFVKPLQMLIAGDTGKKHELQWPRSWLGHTRVLIAGHHGSKNSTSKELLFQMPQLNLVIFSSRRARHNHPHPQVLERLLARRIPHISTEHWGTLLINLSERACKSCPSHERQARSKQLRHKR